MVVQLLCLRLEVKLNPTVRLRFVFKKRNKKINGRKRNR